MKIKALILISVFFIFITLEMSAQGFGGWEGSGGNGITVGTAQDSTGWKRIGTNVSLKTSTDKTGLGTSDPKRILHIYEGASGVTPGVSTDVIVEVGSGKPGIIEFLSPTGTSQTQLIAFTDGDTPLAGSIRYQHSANEMTIFSGTRQIITLNKRNFGFNTPVFDGSAEGMFAFGNAITAPAAPTADQFGVWSADWNGAGTAAMHILGEEGTIHVFGKVEMVDSLKVHREMSDIVDDGEIVLATGIAGFGDAMIGDNQEWAQFRFTSAGVVTLIANTANVVNTDTDTKFCIYDAGTGIAVKNRLGSKLKVAINVSYYTP